MVAIKFIKNTPLNKIGDVTEINDKGFKLYLDEGVAIKYCKVPKQLRNKLFRFTKLKGKIPFEKAWQKTNNYVYDDKSFTQHKDNAGIICGINNLVVVDIDGNADSTLDLLSEKLPKTYTVRTGKQGFHLYYIADEIVKTTAFAYNDSHIDLKAEGGQVVIEGSIHPETKKVYSCHHDVEISKISKDELLKVFNIVQKNGVTINQPKKTNNNVAISEESDESRSAREYREICRLVGQGKNKEEIFQKMSSFAKWASAPDSYKEYTYNKAENYIKSKKQEPVNNENIRFRVFELLCDSNKETRINSQLDAEEILVLHLKNKFRFKTILQDENNEMWGYCDGIYIKAGMSLAREELRMILGKAYNGMLVSKVLNKLMADTYIEPNHFFKNDYPYLLPVANGLLNLKTLELLDFDSDKIFFTKLNIKYVEGSKCPNILKHFNDAFENESDVILLQEAIGNCLIKKYTYQKAVMMVGSGRNGKGVTLDLLSRLLGAQNTSAVTLEQLEKDQYSLSELHGKLANIGGDLNKTSLNHTGTFKTATGGDLLTAPRKFLTPMYFINYAKFFFACNELPMIEDTSRGFWDRWLYFDFPYTFIPVEEYNLKSDEEKLKFKIADPKIKEKLFAEKELEGFLIFALVGMKRLMKNNCFTLSETFENVKIKWMRQSDSFKAFCQDNIVVSYEDYVSKGTLKKQYMEFVKDNKLKPENDRHIKAILTTEYGAIAKQKVIDDQQGVWVWEGLKWNLK